jgi:hypothetical protein
MTYKFPHTPPLQTPGYASPPTIRASSTSSRLAYDVINEILEITRHLPIPLTWKHVKEHQNDRKKWYKLTRMETLNVRADRHAIDGLALAVTRGKEIETIPSSKIALRVTHRDIGSHYATHIRKAASHLAMLQHVFKHTRMDQNPV